MSRSFVPRNTPLYRVLVQLGPTGRYSVTIGLLTCMLIIWFYFIYKPICIACENRSHYVCTKQQIAERITHAHQHSIIIDPKIKESVVPDTCSMMSHEGQIGQHVKTLFEIFDAANIALVSYSVNQGIRQGSRDIHGICVIFSGTLLQVIDLLTRMQQHAIPATCASITWTNMAAEQRYKITIDLKINTFAKEGPLNLEQAEGLGG